MNSRMRNFKEWNQIEDFLSKIFLSWLKSFIYIFEINYIV